MIAYPVEDHKLGLIGWCPFQDTLQERAESFAWAAVGVRDPVGEHPGAVGARPPKDFARQHLLLGLGAQEQVGVHPRLGQQLGDGSGMAEGVDVAAHRSNSPEAVLQEALRVQRLADKGFPVRQVAIRFDPPAPHHDEASLRHSAGDSGEHVRVDAFHPFQIGHRVASENEVVVLVHTVESGAEGRSYLMEPFLPLPKPHRVDMSVAHHIEKRRAGLLCL